MKKLVLLATLMAAFGVASAVEVGVNGSIDNYNKKDRDGFGLTVGEHFGKVSVTAEADREIKRNLDKFSAVAGYDVITLGGATLTAKVGGGYLDKEKIGRSDRFVGLVGAGVSVPVNKNIALTVDYRYQDGDKQVKSYNGNTVAVGAKYSF
jgi:opacity protein-like surface antigen